MVSAEIDTALLADDVRKSGVAARLADQVVDQSGRLADRGLAKLAELAEDRKQAVAQKLDVVVEVVREFGASVEGRFGGAAGTAIRRGGDAVESAAQSLRTHSVGDFVDGTRSLVSRHPGLAIGAASIFGFVAGRIAKGGLSQAARARYPDQGRQKTEAAA